MSSVEKNLAFVQRIGKLRNRIGSLSFENHCLKQKLENYKNLLNHSQTKLKKLRSDLSGQKPQESEEIQSSFLESEKTIDLTNYETINCWISKRDVRRESVTKRTRRNYSLNFTNKSSSKS